MAGLNKIMIIGNVGRDPEMRYAPSGAAVTKFSVATSRVYTTREGEKKEETEWFTVEAWNRLGETVNQFVAKGRRIYVEGRLRSEPWTGKDGTPRSGNTIVATEVVFLDQAGGMREDPAGIAAMAPHDGAMEPEDLPF